MKPALLDFTIVIKILKLRKERHELLAGPAKNYHRMRRISKQLYELTGNEIYIHF